MTMSDGAYYGMHLFWWAFWIIAMVSVFGFNVPERTAINSLDPRVILKRRLAKGAITDDEYQRINTQLASDDVVSLQDISSQTAHLKIAGHPIVDGLSFSVTWAIFYSICALLFAIAPSAMMTATSQLYHGMSFTQMARSGAPFRFGDFVSALTVGAVYTFAAGIVWSLTHSYFLHLRGEGRLKRIESLRAQNTQLKSALR